ncbi:hypothetical protein DSO57_1021052 [Entomophthora muscae]|uniref:Uncharacterized protein n=1 Tax=Entomophthora muscae TaxID=34485 RepID=A0ACC2SGI0_9FUNG|nr:hypothetical protein DSO57_1021052 [Entomophthora muscae]
MALVLGLKQGGLGQRVSVQFTFVIACVDAIMGLSLITLYLWEATGVSHQLVEFCTTWSSLAYMFLNGALGLNLYLVFVRGYMFSEWWKTYYFSGAFSLATLLSALQSVLKCLNQQRRLSVGLVLEWLCFDACISLVCMFNIAVVCFALHTLALYKCPEPEKCQTHRHIRRFVLRV